MTSTTTAMRPGVLIPLLFLTWCGHFLVDVMIGIWPVYKSLAQIDLAQAGLIVAGGAFIGEGSQIFFGSLSDKGYRHLCIIFGILMAMASVFLTYSSSIGILFVLYVTTCIGSGCFHPSASSLVNTMIPAKRGIMMAVFASGGSLGLASSQLIFTQSYSIFDGKTVWLAIPLVVLAIVLLFFRPSKAHSGMSTSANRPKLRDYLSFFKNSTLRSLYFSQIANQSLYWGLIFILPDVLKSLGHPDWISYGMGHFCFILGGALMMIPSGFIADKYSPRLLMLVLGMIGLVSFYVVILFGGISMLLTLPVLFILGACLAVMNPLAVSFGVRLVPESPGAISAFLMGLVWCVSEAIGPGGVGLMTKMFTDYAPVKAVAILGLLFFVQIYHTLLLPKVEQELVPVAINQET
jgi:FSR family fosmidomycin resistance protein-like MFS transporter